MTDYLDAATRLRVVDVFDAGNETGWVTPFVLYLPALGVAPTKAQFKAWILHGTAGVNTLAYWGNGGNGVTCANALIPHEHTQYRDGHLRDTSWVVFKMVPFNFACNHAGECAAGINNTNSYGVEYESLQNGSNDISDQQLLKGALMYAHDAVAFPYGGVKDHKCLMHGIVAINPVGRRSDPFAGPFNIARHWEHVQGIRRDARVWAYWRLPQPAA